MAGFKLSPTARSEAIARFQLDPRVFDHVVTAFDALVKGDGEEFKRKIADGNEAMGYDGPISPKEKPTAVDRSLGICFHVYFEAEGIPGNRLDQRRQRQLDLLRHAGLYSIRGEIL